MKYIWLIDYKFFLTDETNLKKKIKRRRRGKTKKGKIREIARLMSHPRKGFALEM